MKKKKIKETVFIEMPKPEAKPEIPEDIVLTDLSFMSNIQMPTHERTLLGSVCQKDSLYPTYFSSRYTFPLPLSHLCKGLRELADLLEDTYAKKS